MHKVLERQLKKAFGSLAAVPASLEGFLHSVDVFYNGADQDRALVERSLELTSMELLERNATLSVELANRISVDNLRSAILDAALDCIILMDEHGVVREFNPAAQRTFGYSKEEAVGRRLADLIIPPEQRERHERGLAHYLATGEGPILHRRIEISGVHADGHAMPVELAVVPFLSHGRPMFAGYLRDLTERKQAEGLANRQQALLEETQRIAQLGTWEIDLDTGVYTGSPETARMFGVPMQMDLEQAIAAALSPSEQEHARQGLQRARETGSSDYDLRVAGPDGKARIMRNHAETRHDPRGKARRILGYTQDVTAQREVEEQRRLVRELGEIAKFKTTFLNNAAHELATPLTPIKLQMASLRQGIFGALTPDQAKAMGVLERNLERLGLLVRDLLEAARLQGGRLSVAKTPVDVASVAEDVVASFAARGLEQGVAVTFSGPQEACTILGDGARLGQVLFNLVHNALKFTPRGGRIGIGLDTEGDLAVLTVKDTGIGVTPDQIGLMFQPFSQVHDKAKHDVGGTGLGLYISRGIVEQLGGSLTCHSEGPGLGCTFAVRLPLAPPAPKGTSPDGAHG